MSRGDLLRSQLLIPCRTCNVDVGLRCRTQGGKQTATHLDRAHRAVYHPSPIPSERGLPRNPIQEAVAEVMTHPWSPAIKAVLLRSQNFSSVDDFEELVSALGVVVAVLETPPEVSYECPCGAKWTTRERPQGCPLCRAPNCDLHPRP